MSTFFPKVDPTALAVVWAPLLVKPITHGPENFVAAIAARSESGEVGCYPLVNHHRTSTLFPHHADTV